VTYTLLAGLKVLELGRLISAPYCGKLLADMGAEVTKIEPAASGDPARQYGPFLHDDPRRERSGLFLYLNANKQGITLNLATPTGQHIFRDLVARADALVHNLPVQDMGRVGLDYEGLSQVNPGLVMASITPFGLTGPYQHYNAYDINLAAAGGICTGLGEEGREPLTFGTPQVGYFAGMAAASSIVMALLARDHVGSGQHIDIAEVETMAGVYNGPEALMAVYQWRMTRRTGHHALDFPYPNCILRCKDGYIFVGAPEGRQWRQLLELMHFTKAELLDIALEHRIPLAPVQGYDEVRHDPSLADLFVNIDRADTDPLPYPGPPYLLADAEVKPPDPAPYLGQHNEEVYCRILAYTRQQLAKLYQTGII
jgi:crotonobetainyl-CoA:carnitine CoA-transferase CaiB-like acyl-CoA transferase